MKGLPAAIAATCTLLVCAAAPVRGQSPAKTADRQSVAWKRQAPAPVGAFQAPIPTVTLEGTLGDKVAQARYAVTSKSVSFGMALEGPIDKGNATTVLADLDGLRGATKFIVDFDVTIGRPTLPSPVEMQTLLHSAATECGMTDGRLTPAGITLTLRTLPVGPCRDRFLQSFDTGTPVFLGARITVGREAFRYVDTVSLADRQLNEDVIGVRGTVGVLTKTNWLLYAEAGFDRSAKGGAGRDLCLPVDGNATLCRAVVWGGPKATTAGKVAFGARKAFNVDFGIAPRFSYDFSNDLGAVEVPLYLLKGSEGGLTGGVSVGMITRDGTPFVRVFVGPALALRP